MSTDNRNLHAERLTTTDEKGNRVYVHPEDVKGKWKNRRTIFYWALLITYLVIPWIYINGKPIILLDLMKREFTFFGSTFFGHDAPLLIFVFLGFTFAIGLVTTIWGRFWCGWMCPQTVFIDLFYRKIEVFIEGKSKRRQKLDKMPWNMEKITKRSLKWAAYIIISLHLSNTFLGYFFGARELFAMTLNPPTENYGSFLFMISFAAILAIDFGWFREQFCVIVCPYGRFQSIMMDESSMLVAYDPGRGEPRKNMQSPKDEHADCVNCFQCVKVCPTGIDIRNGSQMECIACTMCIDACDDIMRRLDKPEGLISYTTENDLAGKTNKKVSGRRVVYFSVLIALLVAFVITLSNRNNFSFHMVRGNKKPFQVVPRTDGTTGIVNHYKANIGYSKDVKLKLFFIPEKPYLKDDLEIVTPRVPYIVKKGINKVNLFFKFRKKLLKMGSHVFKMKILKGEKLEDAELVQIVEVKLVGPF